MATRKARRQNDTETLRRLTMAIYTRSNGRIRANSRHYVGSYFKVLETGMWLGEATWNGERHERRAKNRQDLLCELRKAFGLFDAVTHKGEGSCELH